MHPAARAAVSAVPPSRSDEPKTSGRSSDSQAQSAACLLAGGRRGSTTRNGQKRPTSSPGHSGGAVPESHRSSLFAGRARARQTGHQRQLAECRGRARAVNQADGGPQGPQGLPAAGAGVWSHDGRAWPRRQRL